MELRYYQHEAVESVFEYFRTYKGNPIVSMPTGTGKSVVIGEFIRRAFTSYSGQRIIKLTHRKELIAQNYEKLIELWPTAPAGIYSAGLGRKEIRPVTFAGIASVAKKAELFGCINLVLVDECHLISPKDDTNYGNFLADLRKVNPMLKVVGFTATPYRLGQGRLIDHTFDKEGNLKAPLFTHMCYDITGMNAFNRLIEEGFLCKLIPRQTQSEIDLSEVHIVGGEYDMHELQHASDKAEITHKACQEICHFGKDRKSWLVFATGITHSEHVVVELRSMGVDAWVVHSKMETTERDRLIAGFKAGTIRCLVNNDVLTTGLDVPSIDLIAMLRATTSPGLWVQMLGRGTRPFAGKENCLCLDFAGNTRRLGPINDPIIPRRRGQRGEGGAAPVKLCEACGTYNHASARICISCGETFPEKVKISIRASEAELIKEDKPDVRIVQVSNVTYAKHTPRDGRPTSLKVSYFGGLNLIANEWICLEHTGLALHKAHDWWRAATGETKNIPKTVNEAKSRIEELDTPTHIRVWINKKHPQIMDRDYSGTGFNSTKSAETEIAVTR